ncbi:hypothetical protein [Burkholderia cenocepacia]|uniref:hypothetical protein n=1 Tax=Burkholderia cenocepacia TaxID=95486 RepID=UPI000AB8F276|nr:hypothetical protein [Burkholderia cenocepacia]
MDNNSYAAHAASVFAVFEKLRMELATECDDSVVLNRLHEISTLPKDEFFTALSQLAGTHEQAATVFGRNLTACAPLPF